MQGIQEVVMTAIMAILVALVGVITDKVVKFLKDKGVTDLILQKKEIVRTVVYAIEQIYHDASGPRKLAHAKELVLKEFSNYGINVSEEELELFIEAVVGEFNKYSKDVLPRAVDGASRMKLEEDTHA